MPMHIDTNDSRYRHAAAEILRRHDNFEPEANITSAVRDFLIPTGLVRSEEMVEENPPSGASRRAVDLTALDTFIEFKRRTRRRLRSRCGRTASRVSSWDGSGGTMSGSAGSTRA